MFGWLISILNFKAVWNLFLQLWMKWVFLFLWRKASNFFAKLVIMFNFPYKRLVMLLPPSRFGVTLLSLLQFVMRRFSTWGPQF